MVLYYFADSVTEGYRYQDVVAENATTFVVTGLDLDTEYVFSIMGLNKLGSSKYLPDNIKARTSSMLITILLNLISINQFPCTM